MVEDKKIRSHGLGKKANSSRNGKEKEKREFDKYYGRRQISHLCDRTVKSLFYVPPQSSPPSQPATVSSASASSNPSSPTKPYFPPPRPAPASVEPLRIPPPSIDSSLPVVDSSASPSTSAYFRPSPADPAKASTLSVNRNSKIPGAFETAIDSKHVLKSAAEAEAWLDSILASAQTLDLELNPNSSAFPVPDHDSGHSGFDYSPPPASIASGNGWMPQKLSRPSSRSSQTRPLGPRPLGYASNSGSWSKSGVHMPLSAPPIEKSASVKDEETATSSQLGQRTSSADGSGKRSRRPQPRRPSTIDGTEASAVVALRGKVGKLGSSAVEGEVITEPESKIQNQQNQRSRRPTTSDGTPSVPSGVSSLAAGANLAGQWTQNPPLRSAPLERKGAPWPYITYSTNPTSEFSSLSKSRSSQPRPPLRSRSQFQTHHSLQAPISPPDSSIDSQYYGWSDSASGSEGEFEFDFDMPSSSVPTSEEDQHQYHYSDGRFGGRSSAGQAGGRRRRGERRDGTGRNARDIWSAATSVEVGQMDIRVCDEEILAMAGGDERRGAVDDSFSSDGNGGMSEAVEEAVGSVVRGQQQHHHHRQPLTRRQREQDASDTSVRRQKQDEKAKEEADMMRKKQEEKSKHEEARKEIAAAAQAKEIRHKRRFSDQGQGKHEEQRGEKKTEKKEESEERGKWEGKPLPTVGEWAAYFIARAALPDHTVHHALNLLRRLSKDFVPVPAPDYSKPNLDPPRHSPVFHHALLFSALVLSTKFHMDSAYSNKSFCVAAGKLFSPPELASMEVEMFAKLGFRMKEDSDGLGWDHVASFEDGVNENGQETIRVRSQNRPSISLLDPPASIQASPSSTLASKETTDPDVASSTRSSATFASHRQRPQPKVPNPPRPVVYRRPHTAPAEGSKPPPPLSGAAAPPNGSHSVSQGSFEGSITTHASHVGRTGHQHSEDSSPYQLNQAPRGSETERTKIHVDQNSERTRARTRSSVGRSSLDFFRRAIAGSETAQLAPKTTQQGNNLDQNRNNNVQANLERTKTNDTLIPRHRTNSSASRFAEEGIRRWPWGKRPRSKSRTREAEQVPQPVIQDPAASKRVKGSMFRLAGHSRKPSNIDTRRPPSPEPSDPMHLTRVANEEESELLSTEAAQPATGTQEQPIRRGRSFGWLSSLHAAFTNPGPASTLNARRGGSDDSNSSSSMASWESDTRQQFPSYESSQKAPAYPQRTLRTLASTSSLRPARDFSQPAEGLVASNRNGLDVPSTRARVPSYPVPLLLPTEVNGRSSKRASPSSMGYGVSVRRGNTPGEIM